MKIKQQHFSSIDSTQTYLREALDNQQLKPCAQLLVSAENQTQGHGRHGKSWDSKHKSLYLSFTLEPHDILTLTALEVAVLCSKFLQKRFNLTTQIKWPNDLIYKGKKCGGVIIQNHQNCLLVGVGINFKDSSYSLTENDFEIPATHLDIGLENAELTSYQLYEYILNHRLSSDCIREQFCERCSHLNLECNLDLGNESFKGIFHGTGEQGEALLQNENEGLRSFYSGTLRYNFSGS
jgi:BirA family biotin operon repressor/biotin-[acetyl-CoA-carboxylase] ligase